MADGPDGPDVYVWTRGTVVPVISYSLRRLIERMRIPRPDGYGREFITRDKVIPFAQLDPNESAIVEGTRHYIWRVRPQNHWDARRVEELYVWYGDPDENPEIFDDPEALKQEIDLRTQQLPHLRDLQISTDAIRGIRLGRKIELIDTNRISTGSYIARLAIRPISAESPGDRDIPVNFRNPVDEHEEKLKAIHADAEADAGAGAVAVAVPRGGRRRRQTKRKQRRSLRRRKITRRR